jgi:hypothetical protein
MFKKYGSALVLIFAQITSAGIFDIVEGAGETAVSPIIGLSPEHSFRYHAGEGLSKIGEGTRDVIRSPLTLGVNGDDYSDDYTDYTEQEVGMLQADPE